MKKFVLFLLLMGVLNGCGGGTSGTSPTGSLIQKTFQGNLTGPDGQPLARAKVEIEATGQTTTTDENGYFQILAEVPPGPNNVIVTTEEGKTYLIYSMVIEDDTGPIILRSVATPQVIERYKNWSLTAEVIGKGCKNTFFGNVFDPDAFPSPSSLSQEEIDGYTETFGSVYANLFQEPTIPVGSRCTLIISITKDGVPVPGLKFDTKSAVCRGKVVNHILITEPLDIEQEYTSAGVGDANGVIEIPFTIEKRPLCQLDVDIPEFGDLKYGGTVSLEPEYLREYLTYMPA